jgi:hypothetical protein
MARGQSQAADKNLATTNALGAEANQERKGINSTLMPGYQSLMDTGYLSPEEEGAATTSEMGAATAPFGAMQFKAEERAGATHNAADLTAQQDQLALEQGRTAGDAAAKLQEEKMKNQEAGMNGLYGLSEQDAQQAERMYGLGPGTLSARAAGKSGDELGMGWLNTATGGALAGSSIHG